MHETEDKLVSYSNSAALFEKLKANNVKHELVTFEGSGHTTIKQINDFEKKITGFLFEIIK